jgi:hypothetical protein
MSGRDDLLAILELARWAPSGDNRQPWTFRIAGDDRIEVLCRDDAGEDVYDFDGRPTLMTLGFLLETMAVAASSRGATLAWNYRQLAPHEHRIDVTVTRQGVPPDPLLPFVETRSVSRGRYRQDALSAEHKRRLEEALGPHLSLAWFESPEQKKAVTRINAMATHIRLSIPEAFRTHQRILDWTNAHSPHGVPSRAIGLDAMTLVSMKWVMQKWSRARFMNRWLAGTKMPQFQMDVVPGKHCAAHFMVFRRAGGEAGALELLETGRSLQRFWLTATSLGLVMQPSLAPICFAWYARHDTPFTDDPAMRNNARALDTVLRETASQAGEGELMFIGRVGTPLAAGPAARSVRKPLASLLVD